VKRFFIRAVGSAIQVWGPETGAGAWKSFGGRWDGEREKKYRRSRLWRVSGRLVASSLGPGGAPPESLFLTSQIGPIVACHGRIVAWPYVHGRLWKTQIAWARPIFQKRQLGVLRAVADVLSHVRDDSLPASPS